MITDSVSVDLGYSTHMLYWKADHAERVVEQLLQELAELQKELLKERLGHGNKDLIVNELADVLLCLEFLGRDEEVSKDRITEMMEIRAELICDRLINQSTKYGYWRLTSRG